MTYETQPSYNLIKSPPPAQGICVRDCGPDRPVWTGGEAGLGLGLFVLIRNIWLFLFGRAPGPMPDMYTDYQVVYAEGEALEAFKDARKTYHLAKLCSEIQRRNLTGSRALAQKKDTGFSGLDIIDEIFFSGEDNTLLRCCLLAVMQVCQMRPCGQNRSGLLSQADIGQFQASLIPP